MTPADFARLVGASRQAVSKACAVRRLDRSVTRDAQGRVSGIDADEGRREWQTASLPKHPVAVAARERVEQADRSARRRPPPTLDGHAPELVFGGLDPLEPGRAFVGIRFSLARFLAGATAALREAGEEATPATLRAVAIGMGDAWWVAAVGALNAALDLEVSAEQLPLMWELEGREAAAAYLAAQQPTRGEPHGS